MVERGTDTSGAAFFTALTVRVLGWLGVARDIFVFTVEVAIVKLTPLGHVHGAVIVIEALWVTVADVLFTWTATFIDTVLGQDKLAAVDVGITRAACF